MSEKNISKMVSRLRRQKKDDASVEVKECRDQLSNDIWESVSAFANTDGGTIILGLSEQNGFKPVENFSIEKVRDQFIAGIGDGAVSNPQVINPPRYQIIRTEFETYPILEIEIEELPMAEKPCYLASRGIQTGSYKRVDDADIKLSQNEIFSLSTAITPSNADRTEVIKAAFGDLDSTTLNGIFTKASQQMPRSMANTKSDIDKMKRLNILDPDGHVLKAGLLVCGTYPQQFFPKLMIDVAVHPGLEKGTGGHLRFIDRTLCEGKIGDMISDAMTAVSKNLKRKSLVQGSGRKDMLEIPEEVLREAISNAIIHRDYDSRFDGQAISVDIFDDRVEIINPGCLWGISKTELALGRSSCRNQTLMRLLSITPMPNNAGSPAEGNGSGVPMMIHECKKAGLKTPIFAPGFDSFKVILWRPRITVSEFSRMTPQEAMRYTADGNVEPVQNVLAAYGELSTQEISELTGLSINQIRTRLVNLQNNGLIEATAPPTSHNRKYRIKN